MYAFILSIVLFFYIVVKGFDSSVKPVLSKIDKKRYTFTKRFNPFLDCYHTSFVSIKLSFSS